MLYLKNNFDFSHLHYYLPSFEEIRNIPEPYFLFFIGLLTLFSLYFFYQCYQHFKHARKIEDTPTAKIRSAAQGYVELEGTQYRHQPLYALLSRLPCTWYRYTIQHYYQKKWRLIEHGTSDQLFVLKDSTGTCFIDPIGARVKTPILDTWQGFSRHPQKKPGLFMRILGSLLGHYRYQEWRMEEDMPLYALGYFKTVKANTTDPKRGLNTNEQIINILSGESFAQQGPYILSAYHQKKIVRSLKVSAVIWLTAYLLLTSFILWLLTLYFK